MSKRKNRETWKNQPQTPANTALPQAFPVWKRPVYEHAKLPFVTEKDVPDTTLMRTLYRALRVRRVGDGVEEARLAAWIANRTAVTMIDNAGNIHVDTREGPQHRTMFTSHLDTVHSRGGVNDIRLDTSAANGDIYWRADAGSCLGADDGAGIALMMHMLKHQVRGYYIFFRGEESGGIGSTWLADNMPDCMDGLERCISFDRAGYSDVITHQAGGRCCSDAFAFALADALCNEAMTTAYQADNTGVFTDSANLTQHIAECTNVSVGYKHQHGDGEWQNVTFLATLAAQLVLVDWDGLPVKRDPYAVVELPSYKSIYDKDYNWLTDSWSEYAEQYTTNEIKPIKGSYEGVYKGTPIPDPDTEELIDALLSASDGDEADMTMLLAAYMLPHDPAQAHRYIHSRRLSAEDYMDYADELSERGTTRESVLDALEALLVVN